MSTRCHTIVTKNGHEAFIYRHCDGYPGGAGEDLKDFIDENKDNLENWSVNDFGAELQNYGCGYEFENVGVHGDEDYVYFVDLNNKVLECYRSKGDASSYKSDMEFKYKETF